jgi:Rod binding domain-containing protein
VLYVNPLVSTYPTGALDTVSGPARTQLAAQELEHLFAFMLLQEMSKTVPEGGLFGAGLAVRYQRELLNDVMAGEMAKSGQLGIAKLVAEQLRAHDLEQGLAGGLRENALK